MSERLRTSCFIVCLLAACGPSIPDLDLPPDPRDPQPRCQVQADQLRPMMVEWPATEKSQLDGETQRRIAVVQYDGCRLQLLPGCGASGSYEFQATAPVQDSFRVETADDLYAKLPLGAASLEATIERGASLKVDYAIVGQRRATIESLPRSAVPGRAECEGATHWVRGMIVGAYEINVLRGARVRAGAEVGGAGLGGERDTEAESLRRGGDYEGCSEGTREPTDRHCQALVQLDLAVLAGGRSESAPDGVTPPLPPGHPEEPVATQDRDGDGVPDTSDLCPDEPETLDGTDDEDGCPDADRPREVAEPGDAGRARCYPGQVFAEGRCRGVPECPHGLHAVGEGCVCNDQKTLMDDDRTCCWPGQVLVGGVCRGVPDECPSNRVVRGEECVSRPEAPESGPPAVELFPNMPFMTVDGTFGTSALWEEKSWQWAVITSQYAFGPLILRVGAGGQWGEDNHPYAGLAFPVLGVALTPIALLPPEHHEVAFVLSGGGTFMFAANISECDPHSDETCSEDDAPGLGLPLGAIVALDVYLGCSFGLRFAYDHRLTNDRFQPSTLVVGLSYLFEFDRPVCREW